jgi:hypothetical protein
MTIFGNRDSGYGGLPPAERESIPIAVEDVEKGPPAQPQRAFGADNRRVVLRVHGGDDIVVGLAEGREPAVQIARDMVLHIEQASSRGEWPQVDERFIRPGAIVSIDVQRPE